MTFNYILSENDFLQHQLYLASKSPRIRKKRRNSYFFITAAFWILALSSYYHGNCDLLLCCIYAFIGLLSLFLYPLYSRKYYKRSYQNHIADIYKNRFGEKQTIVFNEHTIDTIDKTGESQINLSEIEEIIEVPIHFYIRLKMGGDLILPKETMNDKEDVRKQLQVLSEKLGINFTSDLDWKWK